MNRHLLHHAGTGESCESEEKIGTRAVSKIKMDIGLRVSPFFIACVDARAMWPWACLPFSSSPRSFRDQSLPRLVVCWTGALWSLSLFSPDNINHATRRFTFSQRAFLRAWDKSSFVYGPSFPPYIRGRGLDIDPILGFDTTLLHTVDHGTVLYCNMNRQSRLGIVESGQMTYDRPKSCVYVCMYDVCISIDMYLRSMLVVD